MNDLPHRDVDVFSEALQKPPGERAAFLAQACAGDASFRARVDVLLQAHERAGDFLGEPASGVRSGGGPGVEAGEKAGDRIGHYKLLQQIGEGGCGVVFMAEQQEPVRRRVALKVVKPGMDTKSVIARFEAERQALALMDHPNIAHVFEAGATESGRPYFVMELVRGIKITDYCNQNSLTTAGRLELFVQVCEAVQHAHQKGIIHRDIKPSNILVTTNEEGKALPKVIDFGIAKATTGQRLTDKTLFTAFEMLIGTPAYMSPEQAALTSVDVDTRTDVYSLGVLLYELLTGTTPFDTRELLKVGLDEVRRVIRHEEPARPSTRLRTMLAADLTTISAQRRAQPPNLIRELRGDLDWIVMKAMEKDRTRRYQTANALAEDVKHFLTTEAVVARPPSAYYKLQKLALRNKLAFAAGSIILFLLLTGLSLTIWLLTKERQARLEADAARKKAETSAQLARVAAEENGQVTHFLRQIISGVAPSVARGRDTTVLKEILDDTLQHVDKEFTNQLGVAADLRACIGEVYVELGAFEKGAALENEALDVYRRYPAGTEKRVAHALYTLSLTHNFQNKWEEAEKEVREALALESKMPGETNEDTVKMESELAYVISREGDTDGAAALYRKALATARLLPDDPKAPMIETMNGLAMVLQTQGHFDEAEGLFRDALLRERKLYSGDSPSAATLLYNLANVLNQEGRYAESETLCRECVAMRRKVLGPDHPWFESALEALGSVLQNEGKLAVAEPVYTELLAVRRKLFGIEDPRVLEAFSKLNEVFAILHRDTEAQRTFDEMLEASGAGSPEAGHLWQTRAEIFRPARPVEGRRGRGGPCAGHRARGPHELPYPSSLIGRGRKSRRLRKALPSHHGALPRRDGRLCFRPNGQGLLDFAARGGGFESGCRAGRYRHHPGPRCSAVLLFRVLQGLGGIPPRTLGSGH